MSEKTDAVLKGLISLNEDERRRVLEALQMYLDSDGMDKIALEEKVESFTVNFGPSPEGCPCCGR